MNKLKWDFSKLKIGQMVNVQAYKHDGYLYRQWFDAKVVFHNKRHIVLSLKHTRVAEHEKDVNGWKYTDNALWFLPKDSYYNGIVLLRDNGAYHYINMASKPIFEDNTIKFIDYDLDVKCYPDKDLQIVDREEFAFHSKKLEYPLQLKNILYEELKNIITMYNDYRYFFSDDVIIYYLEILLKDKLISEKLIEKFLQANQRKNNEEIAMFSRLSKRYSKR
ncbi:DUF402 domain-containing protein [Mycoplasma nasistruthionis]|uniref:DUF402 domain-containing protein n=1 Tax=Mycoplasma nasistruthionis TaxID=353852 RepID=A0A4Y6I6H9_9MOLU|nr:DUF402 domain-containing protein [Mycoplasma nasistruthionis]QDF65216.1 DUF402 domain-containing protein [Mycoplasma nasistruthionis]